MQIVLDEHGYVKAYALVGEMSDVSATVNDPADIDDFEANYRSYYLSENNTLVKSADKQLEINNERELAVLRHKRDKQCFPYINRGQLWYSKLTDVQKDELGVWYQAWLDVTDTKNIPTAPAWLV